MEPSLKQAYQKALYAVTFNQQEIIFQVGQHSDELDQILVASAAKCATLITAFNPKSELLTAEVNRSNNRILLKELKQFGYHFYLGFGTDEARSWPKEASFLVINLGGEEANRIALKYSQNAYLSMRIGKPVELVFSK